MTEAGSPALAAAGEALAREPTVPLLLRATCRELVELLAASACAVSRLLGEVLVDITRATEAACTSATATSCRTTR